MSSIIRATTSSGLQVAPDNSGILELQTNGTTTAVTIDTSQRAAFVAGTAAAPAITTAGDTNTGMFFPAADTIAFAEGGAEAMRLDSAGNVGIGTTSPTAKLNVFRADSVLTGLFSGTTKGARIGTNSTYSFIEGVDTTGSASYQPFMIGGSEVRFTTSDTERMRIDSNGNVGIGTTSPTTLLSFPDTVGTAGDANRISLFTSGTNIYGFGISSAQLNIRAGDSGNVVFFTSASGTATERMRINTNGTLTSQATYDNTASGSTVVVTSAGLIRRTSSSLKYKKDVETLEQTIVDNAVNNLRPVWYRTKNAEGDDKATWSHIGLIAEEVDLVEPRLVKYKTVEVTQDENGANVTTELETPVPEDVDYAKLSVILLAKVKQLEARLAVLEAK
jgi:hypothetical protein